MGTPTVLIVMAWAACAASMNNNTKTTLPLDQAGAGSERLDVISQSGWWPLDPLSLIGGSFGPRGEPRVPRTPSYAAPLSATDFRPGDGLNEDAQKNPDGPRDKGVQRDGQRSLSFEGGSAVSPPTTRAKKHQAPRDGPPLPLPPRPPPWGEPGRVTPINEPDSEVESLAGYRYTPPILGPGPSPTAPFWEAAWLRRRQRILEELGLPAPPGLPGLPGGPGYCRCLPDSCNAGYSGYALGSLGSLGYPLPPLGAGYGRYGLDPATADLPYRLGVGAYGLYGWSRPSYNHNTTPLGTSRLHDSPN